MPASFGRTVFMTEQEADLMVMILLKVGTTDIDSDDSQALFCRCMVAVALMDTKDNLPAATAWLEAYFLGVLRVLKAKCVEEAERAKKH